MSPPRPYDPDTLPPHSPEAESGALACVLLAQSQAEVDALLGQLRPALFYELLNRNLHNELARMRMEGHAVDLITLGSWLKGRNKVQECGGWGRITALPDAAPSVANFSAYLAILKEKALRRWTLQKRERLATLAHAEDLSPEQLRAEFAEIFEQSAKLGQTERPLIELISIEEAKAFVPNPSTFLVGDDLISRGELSVIGGWPGLGKSRLAHTLAFAGARGAGEWMGYTVQRRFRTLILQSENSRRRIKSEVADVPAAFDPFIRFTAPVAMGFSRPDFRQALRHVHTNWPFDVLVIDHWADVARDEGQADHLEALDNIRASLPPGDDCPAIIMVAHLRKQRGGESWRPKTGREMLAELAGSFALGAKARTVFALQPATMDLTDDRIIFDCAKCSNDTPLPISAWHRKNGAFVPAQSFDWDAWHNPPDSEGRRAVSEDMIKEVLAPGRKLARKAAVQALIDAYGVSQATAYRALALDGKFSTLLAVDPDGLYYIPAGR